MNVARRAHAGDPDVMRVLGVRSKLYPLHPGHPIWQVSWRRYP